MNLRANSQDFLWNFLFLLIFLTTNLVEAFPPPSPIHAQVNGGINSDNFNQATINKFIIDNQDQYSTVELSVNLLIPNQQSPQFTKSCFLLIISGSPIQDSILNQNLMDFTYKIASDLTSYDVYDMDLDGLSTAKKSLSVTADMRSSGIRNNLFGYLLGPYEFGGSTAGNIFTNLGNSLQIFVQYQVSSQRTCLNQCTSQPNGSCLHNQQFGDYCQCYNGYINRDCSIRAKEIQIDNNLLSLEVEPNERTYAYIDFSISVNQVQENVSISLQTDTSSAMVYQQTAEQYGYFLMLPDYYFWLQQQNYINYENVISSQKRFLNIYQSNVRQLVSQNALYIILIVGGNSPSKLEISAYTASQLEGNGRGYMVLYILIGVFGVGTILLTIYIIIYIKRKKRLQAFQGMIRQNGEGNNGAMILMVGMNQDINGVARLQRGGLNNVLTVNQINEFMPAKQLNNNVKQAFNVDQCAVCLEEFQLSKDIVRMTMCQHLFHDECLISWLKKQLTCPFCRQELTLDKLKAFQANPHVYQHTGQINVKKYDPNVLSCIRNLPSIGLQRQQQEEAVEEGGVGTVPAFVGSQGQKNNDTITAQEIQKNPNPSEEGGIINFEEESNHQRTLNNNENYL